MSWSLQISNGDLALGTKGYSTVTGGSKLLQDMRCAVLEPMGTDELHPSYGSVIDGGVDPSTGKYVSGVIGQMNDNVSASFVRIEIQRVAKVHQQQQIARHNADMSIYARSTLTAEEVLLGIQNLNIQAVADHMMVLATLSTGTGTLPFTTPIGNA